MRTCLAVVVASASLLGLAGHAHATGLLASPLPTGVGSAGACYVRNGGTGKVTVGTVTLFSNNGIAIGDIHDFCSGQELSPGQSCVYLVDHLPDDSYAECRVTSGANLRATLEVREQSPTLRTLVAEDLR